MEMDSSFILPPSSFSMGWFSMRQCDKSQTDQDGQRADKACLTARLLQEAYSTQNAQHKGELPHRGDIRHLLRDSVGPEDQQIGEKDQSADQADRSAFALP